MKRPVFGPKFPGKSIDFPCIFMRSKGYTPHPWHGEKTPVATLQWYVILWL